ncbi:MAG: GNAT family N-acetyltransferase [Pseudomonadota bacterium]
MREADSQLSYRKASLNDLPKIIALLADDELGKTREQSEAILDPAYTEAFHKIDADPNQFLMVVEDDADIVGTCHLTLMPSLTFRGATRLQVEAVHVASDRRSQGIGAWMLKAAIAYGKAHDARMVQLTTNKKRTRAKAFYERLGFIASHEGMKLLIRDK